MSLKDVQFVEGNKRGFNILLTLVIVYRELRSLGTTTHFLFVIYLVLLTDSVISTLSVNGNMFTEKQLAEVEGYSAYLERYTAVKRKMD